ncbi:site-specific DNA-methyltransferase [Stenotrophomonas muris]|uniref:DNA-methyltransferase n=1 Tax=Stenotrophomonas muris TaxID=2963283 RepID=UPI002E77FFA6|nr:site-specific DNA-methyltransferase [Stenotrophomonas muris]
MAAAKKLGKTTSPPVIATEEPRDFVDTVFVADSTKPLLSLPDESIHLILSDIPYGIGAEDWDVLHPNTNSAYLGSSPAQEEAGAVFKKRGKPINGWTDADRAIPRQYQEWCASWASEWLRVLKPGASAVVFAGRRFSHRCICAMEDAGFSFKDMLAWHRGRAPHRAQRLSAVFERRGDKPSVEEWQGWRLGNLRPSFEPVLWFTKPYKIGGTIADNALTHGVGGYNEEGFLNYVDRPDNQLDIGFSPKEGGLHPTQKPVRLMQALVELTTKPGQLVLDPFCGSGSTLVAARNTGRHYVGCDISSEYVDVARSRLAEDLFSKS